MSDDAFCCVHSIKLFENNYAFTLGLGLGLEGNEARGRQTGTFENVLAAPTQAEKPNGYALPIYQDRRRNDYRK
jgi:hypothetical protein